MSYEIKSAFQIASRKRAAGDQARSPCSLPAKLPRQASTLFIARTDLTPFGRRDGSPLCANTSRAASYEFLIVTPRLEFPATATKQRLRPTSNRDKIAVFSSGFPALARNRQQPWPPEFLIANLESEFRITHTKLSPLRISNRKFSPLLRLQFSSPPRSISANEWRVTHHSSLSVLIHGGAIKIQRNPCKDNNLKISNRRRTGGLRNREPQLSSRLRSNRIASRRRIARTSRKEVA